MTQHKERLLVDFRDLLEPLCSFLTGQTILNPQPLRLLYYFNFDHRLNRYFINDRRRSLSDKIRWVILIIP